jgi:hypothetical protein
MAKPSTSVPFGSLLLGLGGLAILPAALPGCKGDQLRGADAEVKPHTIKVTMPAVPSFDVPKANADGSHSVKEMRVQGYRYLKTDVALKGYVVWTYDCVTAIRQPNEADDAVKKRIEENPTLCRRPAFYIGDAPDTPVERAAWVVEVPRPYTKLEKDRLPKEEIEKWPAVPPYKVGDEVVVHGQWNTASPHGESNTEGLLVYSMMKNVTQNWESPAPVDVAAPSIQPPPH